MKTTSFRGYFAKLGLGAGVAVALGGAPVVAHAEDNMPSSPSSAIESGSSTAGSAATSAGNAADKAGSAASGAADKANSATTGATDDSFITGKIQGQLSKSGSDASDIKVDTDKGVVTLSGTVHSQSTRDSAGKMAMKVKGVERVKNDIEVLPTK